MANKKIKTKDAVKKTIKTLDKSAVAGERMKRAYLAAKDRAEQSAIPKDASANEYAADSIGRGTETVARKAAREFDKTGRRNVAETKKNVDTVREKIKRHKEQKKERINKESDAVPQKEQTPQKKARTDQKQSGEQRITNKNLSDSRPHTDSKSHTRRRAVRESSGQIRYGYKITDKKDAIRRPVRPNVLRRLVDGTEAEGDERVNIGKAWHSIVHYVNLELLHKSF